MRTRIQIGLLGLVLAAFMALPQGATAAKQVWNFNMFGGKRAVTKGIEVVKDIMEKESNGQFELNIQYGSALGSAKQTPDGIKIGAYEAGQMCVGYYPGKFPLLSVMELPFLAPRSLPARAAVEREVLAHPAIVKEMADRWNIRYLAPAFLPAYEFMGNRRIETAADMKGVKMRISGLNATALQNFGAVPTMVTAPEGYQALDRGTIDMFGFPWSYAFGAYKLFEVSKYATEGLGMSGFMCFQGVSIDAYNRLPNHLKQIIPDAQIKATDAMIAAYNTADEKWIPIFKKRLEVVEIKPSVRAQIAAGASKIWTDWAKKQDDAGRPGTEILNFVKAATAKYER